MIETQNLTYNFDTTRLALSGINLSIPGGTICGLLGPNGAGKTTLLKTLCGLRRAAKGQARIAGHDAGTRHPGALADVFFLGADKEVGPWTPAEFVERNASFYPRFNHSRLASLIRDFDIPDTQRLDNMSVGQARKFMIAFGIASVARVLLLDEPTSGLDIRARAQLRGLLLESFAEDRVVVIATHQVDDISKLVDRLVILQNGSIALHETINDIQDSLSFRTVRELSDAPEALAWHRGPGGFQVVTPRTGGPTEVDFELLYHAATESSVAVTRFLEGKNHVISRV